MTFIFLLLICILILIFISFKFYFHSKRSHWKKKRNVSLSVGFFHPYCNAGGGGERVLWCAIQAVQNRYNNAHCVVYTGDDSPGNKILEKAEKCFNIKVSKPVEFIYLKQRHFVEAKYYPFFTLLLQSLGSFILGFEAAFKHVPDIYVDTMGYAWTYPIFKYLCSSKIGAYVHYPTISTDMLSSVAKQNVSVNNKKYIAQSKLFSYLKILYYRIFAILYRVMGQHAEVIMVNSSWTLSHILTLWKKSDCTFTVYPPCDVSQFETLSLKSNINRKHLRIISVAQFRPEKDHELQLKSFKCFLEKLHIVKNLPMLVLIGSCRHDEDYSRIEKLKSLCSEIDIEENVEFKINLTFDEIIHEMENADVALHTMWNEHFGIGVVECMSAGLIMIAHNSGGPKCDIITVGKTGFLASDIDGYADALELVWKMDSEELFEMRKHARDSVSRFSTSEFEKSFLTAIQKLF